MTHQVIGMHVCILIYRNVPLLFMKLPNNEVHSPRLFTYVVFFKKFLGTPQVSSMCCNCSSVGRIQTILL